MISVIIPNYNNSNYLGGAIQSVLNQTCSDYEIIIVDDGSTDNSRAVVDTFRDKVRYIYQQNQGLAAARNTGIKAANGQLIGLLDADDVWHPDYLKEMSHLSEKYPDGTVFYCMAQCMDINGFDLPQYVGGPPIEPNMLYQKLLRSNFIIPSTVIFRKEPIVNAGCFDGHLRSCEDWDLWLRLLPTKKIIGLSKPLVRYRVHGGSLSTNVVGMHKAAKKVVEKHFGKDDGNPSKWSSEKRRAYGGVYRYQCITFVQRQGNWDECVSLLQKAIQIDPSLVLDLDFFYELGLGGQQIGFRGNSDVPDLEENALQLEKTVRALREIPATETLYRTVMGTAEYALGLIAYNSGKQSISRVFFLRALYYSPRFLYATPILGYLVKSFINRSVLTKIKKFITPE